MDYIDSKTGDIVSRREVMRITGASVPQGESAGDYFPILPSDPPIAGAGQVVTASAPVQAGDTWVMGWEIRDVTTEELKQRQASAIDSAINLNNAAYETAIAALTSAYPPSEIATWERQRAESLAWSINADAPTPWIDIASTARGIPRDEYLARTLSKATQFAQASAYLTGLRQRYEHDIKSATTAEQLAAIAFDYSLKVAP